MNWIKTKQLMPNPGQIVLAFGNGGIIRASWVPKNAAETDVEQTEIGVPNDEDEDDEAYYLPEGWYELIDNWDDYRMVLVRDYEITHWMPLPNPPAE